MEDLSLETKEQPLSVAALRRSLPVGTKLRLVYLKRGAVETRPNTIFTVVKSQTKSVTFSVEGKTRRRWMYYPSSEKCNRNIRITRTDMGFIHRDYDEHHFEWVTCAHI